MQGWPVFRRDKHYQLTLTNKHEFQTGTVGITPKLLLPGCQSGKFQPKKESGEEYLGQMLGYEIDSCGKPLWFVCYRNQAGGVPAVAYVKARVWREDFAHKVRTYSGQIVTFGCHLPPKSSNSEH